MTFDSRPDTDGSEISKLVRIDLNLLVRLHVLLEERSVTRAAHRLGLTQPAMSHNLTRCRKLFGDELLTRVGPTLELTARGRMLLAPLSATLHGVLSDVLDSPAFTPATSHRRFRIAATATTIAVVLPPLIERISASAPGVSLQALPLPSRLELVDQPDTDLMLLPDALVTSLPCEHLYDDHWVVVTRRGQDTAAEMTVDRLSREPHIVFDLNGQTIPPYSVMNALNLSVKVQARTENLLTIPFLVAESDALAIIQLRIARKFERFGMLDIHPLPFEVAPLRVGMAWNPRLGDDVGREWLRGHLLASVSDDSPVFRKARD